MKKKSNNHHISKDIEKDLNDWHTAYEKIWESQEKLEKLLGSRDKITFATKKHFSFPIGNLSRMKEIGLKGQ